MHKLLLPSVILVVSAALLVWLSVSRRAQKPLEFFYQPGCPDGTQGVPVRAQKGMLPLSDFPTAFTYSTPDFTLPA